MNLVNYSVTGLHHAYDAVCEEAESLGVGVTGSELVGLAPTQALTDVGHHALRLAGQANDAPEDDVIAAAIQYLGLSDKAPFDPGQKIIERRLAELLGE